VRYLFLALVVVALFTASAWGGPGSVISSFVAAAESEHVNAWAAYRDRAKPAEIYVLCEPPAHVRRFSTAGSLLSTFLLETAQPMYGADSTHLGSGYMGICGGEKDFKVLDLRTGKTISSFFTRGAYVDFFYDGNDYYFKPFGMGGYFDRYSTNGVYKGSVFYPGYPLNSWFGGAGYSRRVAGAAGSYIIVDLWSRAVTFALTHPAGSFVTAWHSPADAAGFGSSCGPGAPGSYGPTFWAIYERPNERNGWLYQIDIGGAIPAVEPASLGKIKTIYR